MTKIFAMLFKTGNYYWLKNNLNEVTFTVSFKHYPYCDTLLFISIHEKKKRSALVIDIIIDFNIVSRHFKGLSST